MSQCIKTLASCPENEGVEDVSETSELELILDPNKRLILSEVFTIHSDCIDWIQSGMNFPIGTWNEPELNAWKGCISQMANNYNSALKRAREQFNYIPESLQPYEEHLPSSFTELKNRITILQASIEEQVNFESYYTLITQLKHENKLLLHEIKKLQLPINENLYSPLIKKSANQILTNFKDHKNFYTSDAHKSCFNDEKLIGRSSIDKALRYLTEDRKILKLKDGCYKVIDASHIK